MLPLQGAVWVQSLAGELSFHMLCSAVWGWASLVAQLVKNPPQCGRPGFDPWVGKIPWRRERLLTPVFWPAEFHGLYSPWGRKEFHGLQSMGSQSQTRLSNFYFTSLLSQLGDGGRKKQPCKGRDSFPHDVLKGGTSGHRGEGLNGRRDWLLQSWLPAPGILPCQAPCIEFKCIHALKESLLHGRCYSPILPRRT